MDDYQICGRCLVQVNSTTAVIAVTDGGNTREQPRHHTDPRALKRWIEDKLYGDNARFEINNITDCVIAISTWHGDPVCSYHLYERVKDEMAEPVRGYARR